MYMCEPCHLLAMWIRKIIRNLGKLGNKKKVVLHTCMQFLSRQSSLPEYFLTSCHIPSSSYLHPISPSLPHSRTSPSVPELEVVGRAVPRLLSGYQRNRREEQQVLQSLREEGLIATPAERASSGVR